MVKRTLYVAVTEATLECDAQDTLKHLFKAKSTLEEASMTHLAFNEW